MLHLSRRIVPGLGITRLFGGGCRPAGDEPIRQLIRLILETAIKDGSSLVCVGHRPDDKQDPPLDAVADEVIDQMERQQPGLRQQMRAAQALQAASSFPRWYNGSTSMPLRYLINGQFYDMMPMPLMLYGSFLCALAGMLVAVNATEAEPAGQRYIEVFPDSGQRRFVEVELVFERDGNLHIRILGVRSEPASAKASTDPLGKQAVPPPQRAASEAPSRSPSRTPATETSRG